MHVRNVRVSNNSQGYAIEQDFVVHALVPNAMHKALAKRVAICQSSAQCARTLMHLLGFGDS